MKKTATNKAYFAGFFDGEGSIGVYAEREKLASGTMRKRWRGYITVAQRPTSWSRKLFKDIGGWYGLQPRIMHNCVRLAFRRKEHLLQVTDDLLPYVRLKKVELLLFREWLYSPAYSRRISQTLKALKTRKEQYGI